MLCQNGFCLLPGCCVVTVFVDQINYWWIADQELNYRQITEEGGHQKTDGLIKLAPWHTEKVSFRLGPSRSLYLSIDMFTCIYVHRPWHICWICLWQLLPSELQYEQPDGGWKYMCININIYRNRIHMTWYAELKILPPKEKSYYKVNVNTR